MIYLRPALHVRVDLDASHVHVLRYQVRYRSWLLYYSIVLIILVVILLVLLALVVLITVFSINSINSMNRITSINCLV